MNFIKKIGLVSFCTVLLMMIAITPHYAYVDEEGDISGKYYTTNINAYINGKYIDSWNIDGRTYVDIDELSDYGYDVVKNDNIGVTRLLSNYYSDREATVYESVAYPLYENYNEDNGELIEYVDPSYGITATPHGPLELIGGTKDTVAIQFSKAVKAECMNAKYIPIYYRGKDVSKHFSYKYDAGSKQLTIIMNAESFSNYKFENKDSTYDDIHKARALFNIYFLNGIEDEVGIKSNKTFKYMVEFGSDAGTRTNAPSKVAGKYKSVEDKVYVVGDSGNVGHRINFLNNGKKVICIEALGAFYWDETRRNIYVYSKTYEENRNREYISKLKEACKPACNDAFGDWIKSTKPSMTLEKTVFNETVEKISSNDNEIVISFNKAIREEYINEKYIQIYMKDKPMSHWFVYDYDKETNTLKLKVEAEKLNQRSDIGYDFSRAIYDKDGNIIESYIGSRFDVYMMAGMMAEDGNEMEDSLRLTCDVTWQPNGDELVSNESHDVNGKIKEVTTWNINGTKVVSLKEYVAEDKSQEELEDAYAIVESINEKPWQYYRRIAQPFYKGNVNDWVAEATPITELVKGEKDSVIENVSNTSNSEITIEFKKDIDEKYINSDHIKIFGFYNEVSNIFEYKYDKESRKLTIKKVKNRAVFKSAHDENGNTYDIYLMKGLASTDGAKLITPIRITAGMVWE